MVSTENTFVKHLIKINLGAFYIAATGALIIGLLGEYQRALFYLIVALCNLYMYFD
mgnify:FL=1